MPRPAISELRLPWVWTVLVFLAMVALLGFLYSRLAEQVSAAQSYVLHLEAQVRSEQANSDSLKADIAKLQSMERLTAAASDQLRMREASSQGVAYVPAPEFIARAASLYPSANVNGRVVVASFLEDRPGQMIKGQNRNVAPTPAATGWLERIAAAIAPANVSASEGDARR
jgi:cell division protein FtsB